MDRPLVAALDIGGTKIAGALGRRCGAHRRPQPASHPVRRRRPGAGRPRRGARRPDGRPAVGRPCARWASAAPGPVNAARGTVSPVNIPGWRGFPLTAAVRERTGGLPVTLVGDGVAMTAAEHWLGAARGRDGALCMVVSTGVGGGLVLDGRLHAGPTGNAGHIGHISVDLDGESCPCGGRGCVERLASGPNIARRALAQGWRPGPDGDAGAAAVAAAAQAGDPVAVASFQRAARALAAGIAATAALVEIETAVIGGGVARAGETLFAPLRARARGVRHARLRPRPRRRAGRDRYRRRVWWARRPRAVSRRPRPGSGSAAPVSPSPVVRRPCGTLSHVSSEGENGQWRRGRRMRGSRDRLAERRPRCRQDRCGVRTPASAARQHPVRPGGRRRRAARHAARRPARRHRRRARARLLAAAGRRHGRRAARRGARTAGDSDDAAAPGPPRRDLRRAGGPPHTGVPSAAARRGNDPPRPRLRRPRCPGCAPTPTRVGHRRAHPPSDGRTRRRASWPATPRRWTSCRRPSPPRETVAAGVLLFDEDDRVLLVDPTYKPGWEFPGGVVEAGEAPARAGIREVAEELGLELARRAAAAGRRLGAARAARLRRAAAALRRRPAGGRPRRGPAAARRRAARLGVRRRGRGGTDAAARAVPAAALGAARPGPRRRAQPGGRPPRSAADRPSSRPAAAPAA